MTYEEAIKAIEIKKMKIECKADRYAEFLEGLILARKALEKQIPTTVKKDEVDCRGYTDLFICGKCGTYIHTPLLTKNCEYNYCPWCGNRLE